MSGYTLTWRNVAALGAGPAPGDGSFLRPDTLGLMEPHAVATFPLRVGRTEAPLTDFFGVEGEPGPALRVRGLPAWDRLGAGMQGGELIIHGDAGDDLGASMRGGRIRVHGNAGHRAGGPDHTSDRGMIGGEVVIDGDAGDFAGLRMRRGLIAIRGRAGASPGYRMIAGTMVVGRGGLDGPGLEMRRGTVLGLDAAAATGEAGAGHLVDAGTFDASVTPMLRLLIRRLADLGWVVDPAALTGRYRLAVGDRFELGKGEVWRWVN